MGPQAIDRISEGPLRSVGMICVAGLGIAFSGPGAAEEPILFSLLLTFILSLPVFTVLPEGSERHRWLFMTLRAIAVLYLFFVFVTLQQVEVNKLGLWGRFAVLEAFVFLVFLFGVLGSWAGVCGYLWRVARVSYGFGCHAVFWFLVTGGVLWSLSVEGWLRYWELLGWMGFGCMAPIYIVSRLEPLKLGERTRSLHKVFLLGGVAVFGAVSVFVFPSHRSALREDSFQRDLSEFISFTSDYPPQYEIRGYEVATRLEIFDIYDGESKSHTVKIADRSVTVLWNRSLRRVEFREGEKLLAVLLLDTLIDNLVLQHKNEKNFKRLTTPQESLTLSHHGELLDVRMYLENLTVDHLTGERRIVHFKSDILMHLSEPLKGNETVVLR